jgi:hypothetical protein
MEEIAGKITEKEKGTLEETMGRLEGALNSSNAQKTKDYTNMLVEQTNGMTMKVKIVSQAKTLASAVEKGLGDKASSEERREIAETVKRLEEAPYRHTEKEMNKLKGMITLLEAKQ